MSQNRVPAPTFAAVRLDGTITLSAETVTELVTVIKADAGVQKRWLVAADALRAEGVSSDWMKDKKNREAVKAFRAGVVLMSFTKAEQSLIAKPIHSCDDMEKFNRRYLQQQAGVRLSRVIGYLVKAEKAEAMTDEEKGAQARATMGTRLRRDLAAWIDRIEKAEATDFSAVDVIKALKAALVLVK